MTSSSPRKRDLKAERTRSAPEPPPKTDSAATENDAPGRGAFPIVAVGASAGGLEAFTQLLGALPPDTGMGFVLVQHLDPDHESQLTQILARATSLPVAEITNDESVRPDHVYVIPRDTQLTIADGVLKIEPRPRSRAAHRPIDAFFESLAQDRRERAVGVVLSGTANDGTLGLEAIKAEGGITFAQDASAKYDSMPRSAVAAGCVDLVLSPADIAKELSRIAKHPYIAGEGLPFTQGDTSPEDDRASATAHVDDETPLPSGGKGTPPTGARQARAEAESAESTNGGKTDGYKKILLLLRNHSGADFSFYKSTTIRRRIARRLVLSKRNSLEEYAGFLRGNAQELDALYSDVLISVTSFFRNPETFDVLQESVLPELLKRPGDGPLRCWVLGCSTGQEAYSIAMAFTETAEKASRARDLQIFATDLNDTLLEKARHGLYARTLAEDISPQRLQRFFVEEEGGYRVAKRLREMVVFARQNLIADPPFSRMDLVSCRNLLIYLEPKLQERALPTFHYALKPGGFLLLGASESIGGFTELFEAVDKKHKIYSRKPAPTPTLHIPVIRASDERPPHPRLPLPVTQTSNPEPPEDLRGELDAQREADRITINQFAPPGVLVNDELEVLQFRGPTGAFLEPPPGKASFDVLKMARGGLMLPLRSAISQARKDNQTARKENVRVKRDGKTRTVNLEVIPLKNARGRCFLILFEEAGKATRGRKPEPEPARKVRSTAGKDPHRIAELETEIAAMREYLQSLQEQHEAANEEVQSAHEEVQSANEEMQSVNEELETSKEELESANEELTTVNDEMSNRNVELNRVNNDLTNLQASTRLSILLLGRDLTIRRFSPQAEKQFDLLVADVGRPISVIRHGLIELPRTNDPAGDPQKATSATPETPLDLESLVVGVIAEAREQERDVLDKSGHWHSLRVRPYVTLDGKVDGAVLVLVDVDTLKRSEQTAAAARDLAESTLDTVRDPLLVLDKDLRVQNANRAFFRNFRVERADTIGRMIYDIGNRQWNIPRLRELLEDVVQRDSTVEDFEVEHEFESLGQRTMLLNVRRIQRSIEVSNQLLVAIEDVTDHRRAEKALREAEEHYRTLVEQVKDYAIFRTDVQGRPTSWNAGVLRVLGFDAADFIGMDVTRTIFTPEDIQDGVPRRELDEAARTGSASNDRWMRRKNGQRFAAAGTTSALRGENGDLLGFTIVMRDQTEAVQTSLKMETLNQELRENDARLQQYSTDLSEAAARKNDFLAMLGHELRNPLSALAHGLDLLGRVTDDSARSGELRAMMGRQTKRISTLLDQLLDISRAISGKIDITENRVDLVDVVREAVETVQPLSDAQKHQLTVSLPPVGTALVMGDAVRLTQSVENLLANAIKYTNEGGQIALTLETNEDEARITVSDNGSGISAEFLPHVFEVFTQAPRNLDRAQGGLGLGLPLVQRVAEMHRGHVRAASPGLGKGSEFVFTLPRLRAELPGERVDHDRPAAAEPDKSRSRRVLIVDDERDGAEALAYLLEAHGHETLAVNDGVDALEAVRTFSPEVVLLDLGLPRMDGYEVAKRLRREHGGKTMLLIAVTGYHCDADRLEQAGFDHHLIKPLDVRKLTALLAQETAPEGG